MKIDLHNHTLLCNHATGSIDEYIQKAIDEDIDFFGFSDHAPMSFDTKYRMKFEDMEKYEKEVLKAKQIYQKDINILLAYEVDYLPQFLDKRVLNASVDYLIGSVHFIDQWGFDNPKYISEYRNKDIDTIWQNYFNLIEAMAKTNHFNIVGHIDLIKVFKFLPKKDIRLIAKNALKAIKKSGMSIELNVAGLRKPIKEAYPSPYLMQEIAELDIPITFSSDAHSIDQIGLYREKIETYAKSFGYTKCVTYVNKEQQLYSF
jgi:histidinol-phosphatase (PHP family)